MEAGSAVNLELDSCGGGGGGDGAGVVRFCRIFTDLVRYNNAIDATAVNKQTKRQTDGRTYISIDGLRLHNGGNFKKCDIIKSQLDVEIKFEVCLLYFQGILNL